MPAAQSEPIDAHRETVLVTEPEFSKARDAFQNEDRFRVVAAPADERRLSERVLEQDCRAVVVGVTNYRGPLYESLAETGGSEGGEVGALIARFGVGHDGIDKRLARRHRIMVTNTPGVLDQSVAEHAMWLIGALARNIAACHRAVSMGRFEPVVGRQLQGRTLAILGFGQIGRRVATAAHFGFGMRVVAADRFDEKALERREDAPIDQIRRKYGLDRYVNDAQWLFREADILSIHLPAIESTTNFVDARRLAWMKPDALIVNTARGSVVDEDALHDALAAGQLGGAALDVFWTEPYAPRSPQRDLRQLTNVVLTPHIGSNTVEANRAMARSALENVDHYFQGDLGKLTRVDSE